MVGSKQSTCITRREAKISADELMIFTLTVAVIQLVVCAIPILVKPTPLNPALATELVKQ